MEFSLSFFVALVCGSGILFFIFGGRKASQEASDAKITQFEDEKKRREIVVKTEETSQKVREKEVDYAQAKEELSKIINKLKRDDK